MRGRIEGEFGPTVLLFAFAGGGKARPGPTAGTPKDDWRSSVEGNLTATSLTERIRSVMPENRYRQIAAEIPLGGLGTPEDVGLAALFLASDASSWITGITLDVSGGRTMP